MRRTGDTGRRAIVGGSVFEERIGCARAVADGDRVYVSGTTGFDHAATTISDDVVERAEQCLRNVAAALDEAGRTFADVVRVRYLPPRRRGRTSSRAGRCRGAASARSAPRPPRRCAGPPIRG
ncbi:Rid family hydrolase [Streptomyces sp. NPDC058632]|uniref:Rid family hydrolase n=1 Tax=Streptomyces sp. NPDC058632 TaxID=3346567 RepID=UPI003646F14B